MSGTKNKDQEIERLRKLIKKLEKSEAGLKMKNEKMDSILLLSRDLICVAGMDGYFKYLNPAWERILGYTMEELYSRPFLDFIHPDDHQGNDKEVEKLSRGEPSVDFENRYIHQDGSIRTISWTATPSTEEKHIFCIGRDITQHKMAEDILREREKFLSMMIKSTRDTIISIGEDGLIRAYNPAAEEMFGYKSEEILGKPLNRLMPLKYRNQHRKDVKSYFATGKPDNAIGTLLELPAVRKNGDNFTMEISLSFGTYDGKKMVTAVARDITQRKKSEAEIRKMNQNLEHKVAEKTAELQMRVDELERYFDATVDRELKMKELRVRIEELEKKLAGKNE